MGEVPLYVSKECGAAFSESGNLKAHLGTHSGAKPYSGQGLPSHAPPPSGRWEMEVPAEAEAPHTCEQCALPSGHHRDTSLIRKRHPLGLYSRHMRWALWRS